MHSDVIGSSLVLGIKKIDVENKIYYCTGNTLLINRNDKFMNHDNMVQIIEKNIKYK